MLFRSRTGRGNVLKLKVNFLPEIITLYKEVRNLKSLGFRVPLAIVNKAHQANQIYPFAISLIESVRTYERTLEKVRKFVLFIFFFLNFIVVVIKPAQSEFFYLILFFEVG